MIIGPLLARFGEGYIPKPGGDKIGRRRLDTHFIGFQKLGCTVRLRYGNLFYSVEGKPARLLYASRRGVRDRYGQYRDGRRDG